MIYVVVILVATCYVPIVAAQSAHGMLDSKGTIANTGTLRILGDAHLMQADIMGWVEYTGNDAADTQLVAPISYANLYLQGGSRKQVDTGGRAVEVQDYLSTSNDATVQLVAGIPLVVRGGMTHNGRFEHPTDSAIVRIEGSKPQRLSGVGSMPILEVNNPTTVDILDDAMLSVGRRLDLQRGILNNRSMGWLLLAENAWLYRRDSALITAPVIPSTRMHMRYYGTKRTITGPELPIMSDVVGNLYQDNEGGVVLSWDAAVHDTLSLRGSLITDNGDRQHSLTYTAAADPRYIQPWAEIEGTLIRTQVPVGKPIVMNSATTTLRFSDAAARGDVVTVALRVQPRTIPIGSNGTAHVHRSFRLAMLDTNAIEVADSTYDAELSLAWRTQPLEGIEHDSVVEVPPSLLALQDSLVLQRYEQGDFADHGRTNHPTEVNSALPGWRTATINSVRTGGDFAIGLSALTPEAKFHVTWLLEGAMQQRRGATMHTLLRQSDLLPRVTPSAYPFDLHAGLGGVAAAVLPDSIVDWVVMELRSEATGGRRYYTAALLSQSGYVLDPQQLAPVTIRSVRTGSYYVVMHHRNHLSVMSGERVTVQPDRTVRRLDLSLGSSVFGGASAMTPLLDDTGGRVWAAPVGDVQSSSTIDRQDWSRWLEGGVETGYLPMDASMDGIVSTDDVNLIWNNRGRSSAVP